MKTDLFTAIVVAVGGIVLAFFVTRIFLPELGEYKVKSLNDSANTSVTDYNYADLAQPDSEVFNYDALNPTVEVYVGDCAEVDENGECIDAPEDEEGEDGENTDDENSDESNPGTDDQENE